MSDLKKLLTEVRACTICAPTLPLGPRPVLRAKESARILIIGQAPGTKVHESGVPWNDASGDRLRDWMGVDKEVFYDDHKIAIVPMGFCYPGKNEKGGDLPPRPECAQTWHGKLLPLLPNIKMTLLAGMYAQAYMLGRKRKKNLTDTVQAWQDYGPDIIPLPHPSWRTVGWQKRNEWFDRDLLPTLRTRVSDIL
jgi:uracil-DNA glycosylase